MTDRRFKLLTLDDMSAEQRRVAARAIAGPVPKLTPPLNLFLRSVELADPVERVGDYVRFKGVIPDRLKEFVILLMARHWNAQYPWSQHYSRAIKAGIQKSAVDQIGAGARPAALQPDEQAVYDFCQTLLEGKSVSDATVARLTELYGEGGIADLIGLMGYYFIITMVHIVDRTPVVDDQAPPLP